MTTVTPAFLAAIAAPVRRTAALLSFDLAAPEAKQLAVVTAPAGNALSKPGQLTNGIEEPDAALATFEPGLWTLDGRFALPRAAGETDFEAGWIGPQMSDANGVLPAGCVLTIDFPVVQKIPCLGLAFDARTNSALADFVVTFFNASGAAVYTEEISGNTDMFVMTSGGAESVRKITVLVTKTAVPFRFPRMAEINFGFRLRFDGENILETSLMSEADPTGAGLPFPRLRAAVRNDGRFDFLDPSDLSKYLQTRQSFEYRHGVDTGNGMEYAHCGAYYLEGWHVTDDRIEFEAAGKTAALDLTPVSFKTYGTATVGALVRQICAAAGLDCAVDAVFDQSPLVCTALGDVSAREALVQLATLASAWIREDTHNTLCFEDPLATAEAQAVLDYTQALDVTALKQSSYFNGVMLTEYSVNASGAHVPAESFKAAPWYDATEPMYGFPVNAACLISNKNTQHAALCSWLLARRFALLKCRLSAETSWRQNPALCVGDSVTVQANRRGEMVPACVYAQALDFRDRALSGETKALIVG